MGRGRSGGDDDEKKGKNIFSHYARYGDSSRDQSRSNQEQTENRESCTEQTEDAKAAAKAQHDRFMVEQTSKNAYVAQHATDMYEGQLSPEAQARIDNMSEESKREAKETGSVFAKYAPQQEKQQEQQKQQDQDKDER